MNLLVVVSSVVVGLFLIVAVLTYFYRRYPTNRTLQALLSAFTVVSGIATILTLLGLISFNAAPSQPVPNVTTSISTDNTVTATVAMPITKSGTPVSQDQPTEVAATLAVESSPSVATVIVATLAAVQPTPIAVREPTYFQSLAEPIDASWRIWSDSSGKATYEDDGYVVWSNDNVASWLSANLDDVYRDFVLQVNATPITFGLVTGYKIAIGWEESNSYYMFLVKPDGKCGIGTIVEQIGSTYQNANCPVPEQNKTAQVRIEVDDGQMRVFIDSQYVGTWQLPEYSGGKIGLGAYNGGLADSGVEAGVKFSNLAIWTLP